MLQRIQQKIQQPSAAAQIIRQWKDTGLEVVFTNGCFDIVHYGHIHVLEQAAQQGQKLVVGLNSDASIKRLKGAKRPLQNEQTRTHVMAALQMVDLVVVFDEDTPLELISTLKPDVLVKGGDWKKEDIVGYDVVEALGGQVLSLRYIDGFSTTAVEQKAMKGE